jgi:hypothetical protein
MSRRKHKKELLVMTHESTTGRTESTYWAVLSPTNVTKMVTSIPMVSSTIMTQRRFDTPVTCIANHPDPIIGKSGSNKSSDNFCKPQVLKMYLVATDSPKGGVGLSEKVKPNSG